MHIKEIDLNLLRVFDMVYRTRNVSRAAEALGITQPATSHALTRLRLALRDPLFMRAGTGVRPTPRAHQLAEPVRQSLETLHQALADTLHFNPLTSTRTFRIHLSDIGESSFMPPLIAALLRRAPKLQLETAQLDHTAIAPALDDGLLDVAIGFLPTIASARSLELFRDRYILLLRDGHPLAQRRLGIKTLEELEYVMVRTHSDTMRILTLLKLEHRVRMVTPQFLAAPGIVRHTDLALLMPRNIAQGFVRNGGFVIREPSLPLQDFSVGLHWSRRSEDDPANLWLRELILELFQENAPSSAALPASD